MTRLSRDAALSAKWTPQIVDVDASELQEGATLPVREWSAHERSQFETWLTHSETGKRIPSRVLRMKEQLVILSCRDENGVQVFEDTPDERKAIGRWPSSLIERIVETQSKLSGITKEELEDLEKNSE